MNYYCCNSALIPNDEVSAKGSRGGMIVLDRTPSLVLQDLHQMMNLKNDLAKVWKSQVNTSKSNTVYFGLGSIFLFIISCYCLMIGAM